jgi:methyl-accepting chemotaxis protein
MEWLGIDRRRLGTGLLVFGLAGMVMATIVAVALVLGAFAARDLDERLAADQARIAASLTRLTVTMESLATTTENAGTTLQTSSDSLADARGVLESASTTMVSLADALNIEIFGSRPFAKASENLAELARTIASFEGRAETLALNLHQNAADAAVMTDQIRQLKGQVNELATRISSFDRIGEMVNLLLGGIVLAALLTAWVGIAGGFCAWVGWRLRRIGAADEAGNAPSTPRGTAA